MYGRLNVLRKKQAISHLECYVRHSPQSRFHNFFQPNVICDDNISQAFREANGLLIMQKGEGRCLEKIK